MSTEVTRARERAHLVQYPKVRVTVTKGPDVGLCLELAGGSARIGTSSENDLVLTDETVSRRHCDVTSTERGIRVTDQGSTNGVLNGKAYITDATFSGADHHI